MDPRTRTTLKWTGSAETYRTSTARVCCACDRQQREEITRKQEKLEHMLRKKKDGSGSGLLRPESPSGSAGKPPRPRKPVHVHSQRSSNRASAASSSVSLFELVWSKRGNINSAALVTIAQCNTLVARCSRQLLGPADWIDLLRRQPRR